MKAMENVLLYFLSMGFKIIETNLDYVRIIILPDKKKTVIGYLFDQEFDLGNLEISEKLNKRMEREFGQRTKEISLFEIFFLEGKDYFDSLDEVKSFKQTEHFKQTEVLGQDARRTTYEGSWFVNVDQKLLESFGKSSALDKIFTGISAVLNQNQSDEIRNLETNHQGAYPDLRKLGEESYFREEDFNEKEESVSFSKTLGETKHKFGWRVFCEKYYLNYVTIYLGLINLAIYLIVNVGLQMNEMELNKIFEKYSLNWKMILGNHEYYRMLTAMFLHAGIDHISGNLIALIPLGLYLEKRIGKIKILIIYFSTGILAGFTSISYNMLMERNATSIGASGAVYGLVGALVALTMINRKTSNQIKLKNLAIYLVLSLYSGMTSQNIDNAAHIGGFFSGILVASILLYVLPMIQRNVKE